MRCKLEELGADSSDAFVQIFDTSHIETEQYYMNILSEDLKPIVSDLRTAHMKDSDTASDVDYQSMVKSIIDSSFLPSLALKLSYLIEITFSRHFLALFVQCEQFYLFRFIDSL